MIDFCKYNNINVRLYAKDDYSPMTTIEIKSYENFNPSGDSINEYLPTIVIDK